MFTTKGSRRARAKAEEKFFSNLSYIDTAAASSSYNSITPDRLFQVIDHIRKYHIEQFYDLEIEYLAHMTSLLSDRVIVSLDTLKNMNIDQVFLNAHRQTCQELFNDGDSYIRKTMHEFISVFLYKRRIAGIQSVAESALNFIAVAGLDDPVSLALNEMLYKMHPIPRSGGLIKTKKGMKRVNTVHCDMDTESDEESDSRSEAFSFVSEDKDGNCETASHQLYNTMYNPLA